MMLFFIYTHCKEALASRRGLLYNKIKAFVRKKGKGCRAAIVKQDADMRSLQGEKRTGEDKGWEKCGKKSRWTDTA